MGVPPLNKFRSLFICIVLTFCSGFAIHAQPAQHRVALVIGNSNYENLINLRTPARDADTFSQALSALGFTVFVAENLRSYETQRAVQIFLDRARKADVALLYFAGHGMRYNDQNYLLPVDFQTVPQMSLRSALNLTDVQSALDGISAIKLIFLDACQVVITLGPQEQPTPTPVRLAPLAPRAPSVGSLIAYATSPGQAAFDGTGVHSLFTGALLDHMGAPDTDIETMLRAVRRDVLSISQGKQVSQTVSSLVTDFTLAPTQSARPAQNSSTQTVLEDNGFSRKPILEPISNGLTASQTPLPPTNRLARLCHILPDPKPSECTRHRPALPD